MDNCLKRKKGNILLPCDSHCIASSLISDTLQVTSCSPAFSSIFQLKFSPTIMGGVRESQKEILNNSDKLLKFHPEIQLELMWLLDC